jgi:hypothetical protein
MASVLLSSITGGGSGGGLRIAPTTAFSITTNLGLGGISLTSTDISTKALVLNSTGKFALSQISVSSSGGGGNAFFSMEIDGTAICTDLDTGTTAAEVMLWGQNDGAGNPTKTTPIIINSSIKIWLQKTGATTAAIQFHLIPLA